MKKYNKETIKYIKKRSPLVKFGSLTDELYTWFYVERNEDGTIEGNTPIRGTVIGKSFPNNNYWVCRENSKHFILEYVCDGIGHIICDDQEYTVKKGDVYLLEPGSNHKYWSDKKKPFTKIWINFESELFEKVIETFKIKGIVKFSNAECGDLFEELFRVDEISLFHNVVCYEIFEILLKIANRLMKATNSPQVAIPEQIYNIKKLIDNSIYSSISIEQICEEYYLSRSYIISNFKKYFGVTPHKYLIEEKIKLSTSLLRNPNKTIKEIALGLGFYDVYHFSKTFKQKMGVSPLEFKKNLKKTEE